MPREHGPSVRYAAPTVWTGQALVIWGGVAAAQAAGPDGESKSHASRMLGDGACYTPATDRWTPLPLEGAPRPRASHSAIWTGAELLIWGGGSDRGSFDDGARLAL